eukprot:g51765.t1
MQDVLGMRMVQLRARLTELGLKPFRAKQVYQWVYQRGVTDFDAMNNISQADRAVLRQALSALPLPLAAPPLAANDGTIKFVWQNGVESVFIPDEAASSSALASPAGTLCVSSQRGCSLTCAFCSTGAMPKSQLRNLTRCCTCLNG